MKLFRTVICVLTFVLFAISVKSQTLTEKQKEREKNKVDIYSSEEKDNLQRWFYEQTNMLGLSESVRDNYEGIISDNVFDMRRLNDKDSGNSQEEIISKFNKLVNKTNASVKPLLTDDQYTKHLNNFGRLADGAINKQKKIWIEHGWG